MLEGKVMRYKGEVTRLILQANPNIELDSLVFYDDYVVWVCQHGLEHMIYSEAGDEIVNPDGCGDNLQKIDPLPKLGLVRCSRCETWTPKEFIEKGLCPMCADDMGI